MSHLVFDIETIGEDYNQLDTTSQHMLTRWIKKTSKTDAEYTSALEDIKNGLGFSPLTGEIVAIGVLDGEKDQGAVYFQAPHAELNEFEEKHIKYKPSTEKDMLIKFWELATRYQTFVTFNGKRFDVPFLMIRSAINRIKPTKHLLSNRYLQSQRADARHVDLFDELTFYGSFQAKGNNLHMWTRAFGIKSPKASGVDGDGVSQLFKEKKFTEIAKYNALDIQATKELYHYWNTYIKI